MKTVTVVGARPQFVKAALVSEALRQVGIEELVVHTGQHYDDNMSAVFFSQLRMAPPALNLEVGSGPHGHQTGVMMSRLEPVIAERKPDWVLVYGDTNSTLAGALVAAKLHIPVAHVEAGLRSFNRAMPEEINRIVTDVLAASLLCPTQTAVDHLSREGITAGVHLVGDVMLDLLLAALPEASRGRVLADLDVAPGRYYLATIHRAENTDDPERLHRLMEALEQAPLPVIFPVHPRTRTTLQSSGWTPCAENRLRLIDPVGYLEMVQLEANAHAVLTDSGGVQKEAFFLGRPCVTLRHETEWVETLEGGWNVLAGSDPERILAALGRQPEGEARRDAFGDGHAASAIASILARGA
jgi:UDP-N-acetylglucosamine 2-epimerase